MGIMLVVCFLSLYFVQKSACQNMPNSPTSGIPTVQCTNPYNTPEMVNGVPKNCAKQICSLGYDCDYNRYYVYNNVIQPQNPSVVEYICCGGDGLRPGVTGAPYFTPSRAPVTSVYVPPPKTGLGQVMMTYFDPTVPMVCYYTPNCSLFPDYLNCVDSARYRTKVCCSSMTCP